MKTKTKIIIVSVLVGAGFGFMQWVGSLFIEGIPKVWWWSVLSVMAVVFGVMTFFCGRRK